MGGRLRAAGCGRAGSLGEPFHYRDERNLAAVDECTAIVPFEQLYRRNGLQLLPFTTLYQLVAERRLGEAQTMLLIPDLIAHLLTGRSWPSGPTPPRPDCWA